MVRDTPTVDVVSVSTLRAQAGDLVLIQTPFPLSQDDTAKVRNIFKNHLPNGVNVIVNPVSSAFRIIRNGQEVRPEVEQGVLVNVPGNTKLIDFANLAKELRHLRKVSGGSYQRFAAAKAGISEGYLWRLETGRSKRPTWKVFVALVHSYGFQIRIKGTRITLNEDLGPILSQCRDEYGLTQCEVGKRIGTAGPTISKAESNTEMPSWDVLIKLFKLYGLELEFALQD